MAKRSLFSILSEQPWWVSLVVAALLFAGVYQFLPDFAAFVALPFVGVAAHVAWKQFRGRAPADAAERLAALREMSWEEFAAVISAAYRRQGYAVEAVERRRVRLHAAQKRPDHAGAMPALESEPGRRRAGARTV